MDAAREAWHARSVEAVLEALESSSEGLTAQEAARRLERYGANRLAPPRPASPLRILATQFRSVVVILLVAAGLVSLLLGDRVEAAAIGVVIFLNAGIGFAIELKARRAMEALRKLEAARASVLREGRLQVVDAETLVPGDVAQLDAGQTVPADGRVLAAADLRTNEAALTGESLPVEKRAEPPLDPDTPLADRTNMVYKGTTVAAGTGRVAVTGTGGDTEIGRIGALTESLREERTPLERRLDTLGRRLVWLALGVAAVVAGLGVVQGAPWGLMVETGIALAVAAVPEALPAVATIALALGLRRMARRNALVRRLPSVEALGSTTVVCTDKTRTLTSGDMTVVRVWTAGREFRLDSGPDAARAGDERLRRALEVAALASRLQADAGAGEPRAGGGDPVDHAMLRAAEEAGIDLAGLGAEAPVGMVAFSSERQFMAAFHRRDGRTVAYAKGAPRRILELAGRFRAADGERPLDSRERARLMEVNGDLAAQGLRVLALAEGEVAEPAESAVSGLTFVGFVGLMDPPAPGVKEAVARLRRAGLRTIMLTGDQRNTAQAIGRDIGVLSEHDETIDSPELRTLDEAALADRLARTSAFSRISPEDKLKIVGALQSRHEIVAMLGDGVNDAPALRKADVGVAMGIRGTDVAKEAAAIVLQDDRFETVVAAVAEGRVIFDNIRKFVFYLFSCNLAEILVLLLAGILGLPLPILPLQILWLNMVTDTFPALALAVEPGDPDVMERPPRDPQEAILSRRFLSSVLLYAGLITGATLAAFLWSLEHGSAHSTTTAFMTLALSQIFHLANARSRRPVWRLREALANRYAIGAVIASVALQLAAVSIGPLARILRVAPLTGREWLVVLGCSAAPALVGQAIRHRRERPAPERARDVAGPR